MFIGPELCLLAKISTTAFWILFSFFYLRRQSVLREYFVKITTPQLLYWEITEKFEQKG